MGHAELKPEDVDTSITPLLGALKRTVREFCATTSIHGLKYARDENTSKYVRFIWMVITAVMFSCSIAMVITFYLDYKQNPTRLIVESDHGSVESLHFPAVTVCPEILYNMGRSKRYITTLKLPPLSTVEDVLNKLNVGYGFINDDESFTAQDVQLLQQVLVLNNLTLLKFVKELRWNCKDLIFRCRLHGERFDCDELFQISRTFSGYCCSFNLNQIDINFTSHFVSAGLTNALSLILHYNDSDFVGTNAYSNGFKVLIGQNNAFPSSHVNAKFVGLGAEVFIAIRPVETFCSRAVRALSIEQRQCVMPWEHKLAYFRAYVGSNCDLNCRADNMLKFCGCFSYFMNNNSTKKPICSYADIPCLVDNFADIVGRFRNTQCSCPNSCESFDYNVELTSAVLQNDMATVDTFYKDIKEDYAVVHLFFNSNLYRRVRRDLLSNMVTLVSNLGSAFSLFVGMSLVSVVEILYYFTVVLKRFYSQELKVREEISHNAKRSQVAGN